MTSNNPLPLVCLKNIGIFRSGKWLVRGIDLTVHKNEIVTLIGPNGSGKSTTSKLALGLLEPDEGTITRQKNLTIGYVPQKLAIDQTMPLTVSRLLTLARHHSQQDIANTLKLVGANQLENTQLNDLSGGEFQRIILARAIINKPDLLVLDEPAQGVDFNGELVLYDLIKQIKEQTQCGVLLISHDLHMVMAQTNTVVCLNGHVCCTGTPQAVASSPDYVKLFGQRAVEGLAVYHHNHDHVHLEDGRVQHADGSITDHCHHPDGNHPDGSPDDGHRPDSHHLDGHQNNKGNTPHV